MRDHIIYDSWFVRRGSNWYHGWGPGLFSKDDRVTIIHRMIKGQYYKWAPWLGKAVEYTILFSLPWFWFLHSCCFSSLSPSPLSYRVCSSLFLYNYCLLLGGIRFPWQVCLIDVSSVLVTLLKFNSFTISSGNIGNITVIQSLWSVLPLLSLIEYSMDLLLQHLVNLTTSIFCWSCLCFSFLDWSSGTIWFKRCTSRVLEIHCHQSNVLSTVYWGLLGEF